VAELSREVAVDEEDVHAAASLSQAAPAIRQELSRGPFHVDMFVPTGGVRE
jgi:hypothetical protein